MLLLIGALLLGIAVAGMILAVFKRTRPRQPGDAALSAQNEAERIIDEARAAERHAMHQDGHADESGGIPRKGDGR